MAQAEQSSQTGALFVFLSFLASSCMIDIVSVGGLSLGDGHT